MQERDSASQEPEGSKQNTMDVLQSQEEVESDPGKVRHASSIFMIMSQLSTIYITCSSAT